MDLQGNELERITDHVSEHVKLHLAEWLAERSFGQSLAGYEVEIRERIVRVEEELRHQRDLIWQGFERMDKRFVEMREDMDKRFEQVDKRLEQVDKRFEQVDKRFEQVDKRFEQMERRMDTRFDALIRRMDRFMIWSFGITVTAVGTVITVLKWWP